MIVWDVNSGSELARIPGEMGDTQRWFTLSGDGKLVATMLGEDNSVCVWDVASGTRRARLQSEKGNGFRNPLSTLGPRRWPFSRACHEDPTRSFSGTSPPIE
jgi:WD40 repeat protein